ncbi:MAG: adenylyltransferase [Firmicutes bacterium HGW-Firmicutes-14]|nr:MAG: adenylyltransferase [Firmicutes bacterium HGW-Firmicutes-14]
MSLNDREKKRYTRHLILDEIGEEGQLRLKNGKVVVVGTGGLGSPVLYYLAAAGVGCLGLVDNDSVDLSNLQRQILHRTGDLSRPKAVSAYEKLNDLNPEINIKPLIERVTADNADEIISGYDIVVDATDNFPSRFILNKACIRAGKPFIHGGILGFFGQVTTIMPGQGPCLQCLFREPPTPGAVPSPPGVVGAVAGTIGTIQAVEAVKIILGAGDILSGRLLMYDSLELSFREITVKKDPGCPVCGSGEDR